MATESLRPLLYAELCGYCASAVTRSAFMRSSLHSLAHRAHSGVAVMSTASAARDCSYGLGGKLGSAGVANDEGPEIKDWHATRTATLPFRSPGGVFGVSRGCKNHTQGSFTSGSTRTMGTCHMS